MIDKIDIKIAALTEILLIKEKRFQKISGCQMQ